MANLITVKSTKPVAKDGASPVVLYERDERHPEGEAWITGADPVRVGNTSLVRQRIREGVLEEVKGGK